MSYTRLIKVLFLALLLLASTVNGQVRIPGPGGNTAAAGCSGSGVHTFDSGTSWTADCTGNVQIEVWGGGGGGGGFSCCATGAGGGGYAKKNSFAVTNGNAVNFTIGAGGATNGTNPGSNGGATTCTACGIAAANLVANGGQGGQAAGGGTGGTASNGDTNTTGTAGSPFPGGSSGGAGGASPNGGAGGAQADCPGDSGHPGVAPGGGGSGAPNCNSNLGTGAGGRVKITGI